jgi:2-alkyl-3-oxoalkanoate reductase
MKIFVAGATGVVGRRLVPLLVEAGHDVVGMSRSLERAQSLGMYRARGVVGDVLDRQHMQELLAAEQPEVIVDELSELPRAIDPAHVEKEFGDNNRIRVEGTRNLVDAARAGGARRIIAQSYAHIYAPHDGWVKSEEDLLNLGPAASPARRLNVRAIRSLEEAVLETPGIEGVVLRYGTLYGPGTSYAADGSIAELVRLRHYPIIANGGGLTSFVHVDDAAAAVLLALTGRGGVYNICDDEPAAVADWLPVYARVLGAPAPRHVPAWTIRVLGREHFLFRSTEQRGASNAKAKAILGFTPCFASWREGFARELGRDSIAA